jgi:UDP-2,3-diacylglucosamine hydrolase
MTPTEQAKQATVVAPADWRYIDFLSDLHLLQADSPTFLAFEQHLLNSRADAIFILGDLFEAWVGDDARDDPFEQRCLAVMRQAAQTRFVGFMHGNRDFLIGADCLNRCGVVALQDPTLLIAFGQRWLLSHGDAWCLADTAYQAYRAQVRSPQWQSAVLSQPLAERRALAAKIRATSEAQRAAAQPESWADVDASAAIQQLQTAQAQTLIHGHTHRPGRHELAPGVTRWVLSDWDFDARPPRADVLRLSANGLERIAPERA